MSFFALQYQMLFHDTMAYGTQHYMTNLKLQNLARETILFGSETNGGGTWQEQLGNCLMLTREAYSLNLAPVGLGEKVAVLLTYEDPSRSTVRLCFRIIRHDGQPVALGYQQMVLMDSKTYELVPAPELVTQYLRPDSERNLLEPLTDPSFGDRARAGGVGIRGIMSPEICELGRKVATASREHSYPKIIDASMNEFTF